MASSHIQLKSLMFIRSVRNLYFHHGGIYLLNITTDRNVNKELLVFSRKLCHYTNNINNDKNDKTAANRDKQINIGNSFQLDGIPFHMDINQKSIASVKLNQQLLQQNDKTQQQQQMQKSSIVSIPHPKLQGLKNTLVNIIGLVEEVTHMDDIRKAQSKVMNIKDKLKESGDKKRQILADLNAVRDKIQKLHSDMRLANRGSDHHIQLLDSELECLRMEKQKQDEFRNVDEVERHLFNDLTVAISDSYEKEKIHANSIRIWGYIQTIVAAFLTFIISIMGYYYHNTKFGLLAIKFEENVNKTLKSEIGSLKDYVDVKFEENTKQLLKKMQENENSKQESWGGYFKRHGNNVYRFFWPKKQ